jgi:transcriptional regulator with XRE-family HTH domain
MDQAPLPNRRLRLQRRLRGWSQDDVAAGLCRVASSHGEPDLGVDATMVSRWERGTRHPRPRYVRLLCELFDMPVEQLGLVRDADLGLVPMLAADRVEGDEGEREAFLREMAGLLGVAPLPPFLRPAPAGVEAGRADSWQRLERALSQRGQVDVETVEHLERVTLALESLEPTAISSRALLGPATGHLDAVTALLQASACDGMRRRLCSIAGEAAGLVGWLRWNLDDAEGACACFRAGLRAAHEADDHALGAYLVGAIACRLPMQLDPKDSLRLLTGRTMGFVQADASPATRAWLAAKEADAWAQLGHETDCMRALERAADIVERLDDDERGRPRFTVVDHGWLAGERGASLAKLGHLDDAQSVLRPVLATLGPTSERDRLWLLTALAGAHADDDDPEEACRLARVALAGAARMHLAPVIHLVTAIRDGLERHRLCQAVQELDEHVRRAAVPALAT